MSGEASRRQFLKFTGSGTAVAVTGATSVAGPSAARRTRQNSDSTINRSGELSLISGSVRTLDPIVSGDTISGNKITQVYEGLTAYPDGKTSLETRLVSSVEVSDDLLTYTFTLKQGITFHDGTELTAADVKYSWRRLAESESSRNANFILDPAFLGVEHEEASSDEEGVGPNNIVPDSLAIEIVDTYTFEVTLQTPSPAALDIIAYGGFGVMPAGLVGDIQGYDGQYTQDQIATDVMVGTGPFQFETWDTGNELTMTAFDNYHDTGPYVDSLHWEIFTNEDARWDYATNKNADIFDIPTEYYDSDLVDAEDDDRGRAIGTYGPLDNGETLDYTGVDTLSTFYVGFNARDVPASVRKAVAYVTDHEQVIADVFSNRATGAFSLTPPAIWPGGQSGYDVWVDEWPYSPNQSDTEAARDELESDGYTESNPFELTITSYGGPFETYGELLQNEFDGLGVDLTVETVSFSELISRGQNGELEAYTLGWIWSWDDPAYGLKNVEPENTNTDAIPETADGFYLNWQDEESDNVQKAEDAWDRVKNNQGPDDEGARKDAYVDIEEARRDDAILFPLYHPLTETVRYQWVEGPRFGALGSHRRQYNEIWLDIASVAVSDIVVPESQENVSSVTVDSAFLPEGGFVGIYDSGLVSGQPYESFRGSSDFLTEGQQNDVVVTLDEPFTENGTAYAMVHQDTNGNETFDYVSSDGSNDDPYTDENDSIVTASGGVSFENSVRAYTNDEDVVDTDGLRGAIDDWRGGNIETSLLRDVIDAWRSGEPVE